MVLTVWEAVTGGPLTSFLREWVAMNLEEL